MLHIIGIDGFYCVFFDTFCIAVLKQIFNRSCHRFGRISIVQAGGAGTCIGRRSRTSTRARLASISPYRGRRELLRLGRSLGLLWCMSLLDRWLLLSVLLSVVLVRRGERDRGNMNHGSARGRRVSGIRVPSLQPGQRAHLIVPSVVLHVVEWSDRRMRVAVRWRNRWQLIGWRCSGPVQCGAGQGATLMRKLFRPRPGVSPFE